MEIRDTFKFIKASQFFPQYAPRVRNYTHKVWGKDTRGTALDFTDQDKAAIRAGLEKLFIDLNKSS